MQFVNNTPAAALCHVANPDDTDRVMTVTVKATFVVDDDGVAAMDTKNPCPVEMFDKETELGIFPQDFMPGGESTFEVYCLGKAHAPDNHPTTSMQVHLAVGNERRTLDVFGDRRWIGEGDRAEISEPDPFVEMPLTWNRTFGGTSEVLIDKDTSVDLPYGLNPLGKGYNPIPDAMMLAESLKAPKGYPVCPKVRPLPNIESPTERIEDWNDAPKPVCWAPLPISSPLYLKRFVDIPSNVGKEDVNDILSKNRVPQWNERAACRAPDELLMSIPARQSLVTLTGMTPDRDFVFRLPALRFFVEYLFGTKEGEAELRPHMLMLIPEERRFYLVFKDFYSFGFVKGMERSVRVRMERGWTPLAKGEDQ